MLQNDKWSDTVMLNSNRDRHVVGVCSQGATEVLRFVCTYRYYKFGRSQWATTYFAFADPLVK